METLSWLCPAAASGRRAGLALVNARIGREAAAWVGTGIAFASFLCAASCSSRMLGEGESHRQHIYTLYTWAGSPTFTVPLSILVDQLR